MEPRNNVTFFILLSLTQNPKEQKVLFVIFLLFYILTVVGSLLIVFMITVSKTLNSPMYFFLASLSFIDLIYSSSISQDWFQTCSLGTIPYPLNLVWPSSSPSTFLVDQKSPFCWWWPMTAMWPFLSPCIIWLSWVKECVLCCWCCPVLEVFCIQLSNGALFMGSHSVAPMSLITLFVTCSPYWNLSALKPISLTS